MNLLFLFAENGAHVSTTVDTAELAKTLGPVWFFAIVCFVAFVLLIIGFGYMFFKFGGKLIEKLEGFLDKTTENTSKNVDNLAVCSKACNVTSYNIENLCDAGHDFANAIDKIGHDMPGVHEDCEKIHDKLRTIMSAK